MNNEHATIIISLTSIKKRYRDGNLCKTINQLYKMNGKFFVVLNISKTPFLLDNGFTDNDIETLKSLYPNLVINITDNFGPLRKIIPTLKTFNNCIIITVDDDTEYDINLVNIFYQCYREHKSVICSRSRIINNIDANQRISDLNMCQNDIKCMYLIPEGVGAVLYDSQWFSTNFINYDFTKLNEDQLKNDDLILRAYLFTKNIPVYCANVKYLDSRPKYGLYPIFNSDYVFNFGEYIDSIKTIL